MLLLRSHRGAEFLGFGGYGISGVSSALTMAHLPESIVAQRRAQLQEEILEGWQEFRGRAMYVVVCPCNLSPCSHMWVVPCQISQTLTPLRLRFSLNFLQLLVS